MRSKKFRNVLISAPIAVLLGCGGGQTKQDCPPCDCGDGGGATVAAAASAPAAVEGEQKAGDIPERSTIEGKYKWTPEEIYADEAAWNADVKKIEELLKKAATFKGKLGKGAKTVKDCLDTLDEAYYTLEKLWVYAHMKRDEDTRVDKYGAMTGKCQTLEGEFGKVGAFVDPELLALPKRKLQGYAKHKLLEDYDRHISELIRRREHILDPDSEALLASMTPIAWSGMTIYRAFTGAELPFDKVVIDGQPVQLSQQRYVQYRVHSDRDVRRRVFESFWNTYQSFQKSCAAMLNAQTQAHVSYAKAHKYDSAIAAKFDKDDLPLEVFETLVKSIHEGLPTFHRYLKLRKQLLGVDELEYLDIYPPMTGKSGAEYKLADAKKLIVEALAPLGEEYLKPFNEGLKEGSGWVDYWPNAGKRSGAYCTSGDYKQHPYVLLNHAEDYNGMSTVAHEMGHAMHSYFSNRNQPHPKADYVTFLAEIASTVNETLLVEHVLGRLEDPEERLAVIGEYLEGFRGTVFRQTMFAAFEEKVFKHVEQGETLTADVLSKDYLEILKQFHGADQGVMKLDELYSVEWAYIPHFYYDHYVFTYATGLIAATALAEKIRTGGPAARDAYINSLLKGGGSKGPLELLKGAGVDMTKPEPYKAALAVFERRLDEAEKLVAARKAADKPQE